MHYQWTANAVIWALMTPRFKHLCSSFQDPEFQPDLVASKSYAAAGLCSWVLNIVKYYEVYCEVEPKRQALSKANAELAAAQDKLSAIKNKINVSCWTNEGMRKITLYSYYSTIQI